jgi:hypothetical protein
MDKHFFEDGGYPQCSQRCIVKGGYKFHRVCICELIAKHPGACERVPTMMLASVSDYERWPAFKNFVSTN